MSDEKNATPAKRRKAGPGRPVGLTPRIQQIIYDAIAAGNYQRVAAQAAGVSPDILQKSRQRGRRGEEPYASLEKAIEDADQKCETVLVAKVMAATNDDWRAAAMLLERKYPERWSKMRDQAAFNTGNPAFMINIHLSDAGFEEKWAQQVQRRTLELAKKPEQLN